MYTYATCKESAQAFTTLTEWNKGQITAYRTALKHNWHRQIAAELGWAVRGRGKIRTYEHCIETARTFGSLFSWKKGHQASYSKACRKGWQRKIAMELGWEVQTKGKSRTYEECKKEAKAFSSLTDWSRRDIASYAKATRKGWQRKIATDLGWEIRIGKTRTYEECKDLARDFTSLFGWQKGHNPSYQQACRKKWQRKIAADLGWGIKTLNNNS